jgi:hypothetical protein
MNLQESNMPNKESKEIFLKYCESEFELIGLKDTNLGKSSINLLQEIYQHTNGDEIFMELFIDMIHRLNLGLPLSPLQEQEIIEEQHLDGNVCARHPRYFHVYKDLETGKSYDEHGIIWINHEGTRCYGINNSINSKIEIEFPYYPEPKYLNLPKI